MHSFIIITKDKKIAEEYIESFCQSKDIHSIDRHFIEVEGSIGIKDIRGLQKDLFLTPVQSKTKAIIIQNGDTLTNEAQNAMLKTLEEPPDNTIIIITAQNKNAFLPTVLSRCQIILLDKNIPETVAAAEFDSIIARGGLSVAREPACLTGVSDAAIFQTAERLACAQTISKTKEDALAWTEKTILALRTELLSSYSSNLVKSIRELQAVHTTLSTTNVSPRFIIENLLIDI